MSPVALVASGQGRHSPDSWNTPVRMGGVAHVRVFMHGYVRGGEAERQGGQGGQGGGKNMCGATGASKRSAMEGRQRMAKDPARTGRVTGNREAGRRGGGHRDQGLQVPHGNGLVQGRGICQAGLLAGHNHAHGEVSVVLEQAQRPQGLRSARGRGPNVAPGPGGITELRVHPTDIPDADGGVG